MTRREITCPRTFRGEWVAGFNVHIRQSDKKIVGWPCSYDADECEFDMGEILPKYKVGEVVAIAQSYKTINEFYEIAYKRHNSFHGQIVTKYDIPFKEIVKWFELRESLKDTAGWTNKMFVKADLMISHIRITNIKIERLQDISDEDCIREGVIPFEHIIPNAAKQIVTMYYPCQYMKDCANKIGWGRVYHTPHEAFAALIDKVSGRGTWNNNPYVFAYEFELID